MDLDISDWNETCISLPSLWENTEDEFLLSNSGNMWNELSFPTPPNTPTEFSPPDCTRTTTKYEHCLAHERRDELISEDELDSEFARELRARAESPAILNDVMWSGELVKRTEFDCCIEVEVRFSHSSTPTRFEEQISNSLVEHEELLAFSFFGNQAADVSHGESTEDSCVTNSTEAGGRDGFSESDEEIDVVNLAENQSDDHKRFKACENSIISTNEQEDCNASNTDTENANARVCHNHLERRRRNDLRNRFQALRECVPALEDNERAAKICILREAAEFIPFLQKEEQRLISEKEVEKKRNTMLLKKLVQLTKNA